MSCIQETVGPSRCSNQIENIKRQFLIFNLENVKILGIFAWFLPLGGNSLSQKRVSKHENKLIRFG